MSEWYDCFFFDKPRGDVNTRGLSKKKQSYHSDITTTLHQFSHAMHKDCMTFSLVKNSNSPLFEISAAFNTR